MAGTISGNRLNRRGAATSPAARVESTDKRSNRTASNRKRTRQNDDAIVDWNPRAVGGALKRLFDVMGAAGLIVFLSPLLIAIAITIKLTDNGPVIFSHRRIGLGGRAFSCLKFRSMVTDADKRLAELLGRDPNAAREWHETQKLRNDVRITGIGRLLRKSSLDELPQLFNILRGEMSFVGPRPVTLGELERYDLDRVHYMRARPGLTGPWQVSGRSNVSYAQRVSLDKGYVNTWTFMNDIALLLRTVPAILTSRGAM